MEIRRKVVVEFRSLFFVFSLRQFVVARVGGVHSMTHVPDPDLMPPDRHVDAVCVISVVHRVYLIFDIAFLAAPLHKCVQRCLLLVVWLSSMCVCMVF